MPASARRRVAQVIEKAVEHPANQHEADGDNDIQTCLGFLKVSELAGPNQPVSRRQFHVVGDALLRLLHRAAQVAAPDAELDRDEALHALVINPRCSRIQGDGGQFAQGDIGVRAARSLIGHFYVADLFDAVAIFRRITDDEIKLPGRLPAPNSLRRHPWRLARQVHITGIQPVARRFGTIHLDVQVGLSEHGEDAQVFDAPHLGSSGPGSGWPGW